MSGVGEIVGVVACITSVISAYHDGSAVIQRIKARRAEKRAPAPPRLLEESIDQAPEEIEREKQRGITRFGKAFEDGDHTAVLALQQITIQLQSSLFTKLREAVYDDDVVDFTSLIDASDLGRDRTIGVLLELRQRLLQAVPINQLTGLSQHQSITSQMSQLSVQSGSGSSQGSGTVQPAAKLQRSVSQEKNSSFQSAKEEDTTSGALESRQTRRPRHSTLLGRFKHNRVDSGANERKSEGNESSQTANVQPTMPLKRSQDESARPNYAYEEGEDNPFEVWGEQTSETRRRETLSTSPNALNPQNTFPSTTSMRQLSTVPSGSSRSSESAASLKPNPDNNYLGFCKGAARLQNGDSKAMEKRKEFNDGWSQSNVYYLACSNSKCAFGGHMDLEIIWTKVWNLGEDKGLKFRWAFLAKSHVCQNKVKNSQFVYQCIFCVFLGRQPTMIQGTDLYLDHISEEHRGRKLGDVVLYRTYCINDRICKDNEEFDINLFPLTDSEGARLLNQSDVVSDELIIGSRKKGPDAQDSIFSGEPWNEGLSDFHFTDEYEHGGRLSLRSFRSNTTTGTG